MIISERMKIVQYITNLITHHIKYARTIWGTYSDLEKHLTYRRHLNEGEKEKYPLIMTTCEQ